MKTYLFLLCLLPYCCLQAQIQSPYFDPEHDPIAVKTDSTLHLMVSEYVLAKSVKTRLGRGCQILNVSKSSTGASGQSIVIEGLFLFKNREHFSLFIPLQPDAEGLMYHASSQALICSAPGCNNCSILNGSCVGCCSSTSGYGIALPNPLAKVLTLFEE